MNKESPIQTAQLRQLYSGIGPGLLATATLSVVLAYILRETIGSAVVVAWLSIVWLVVLSRAVLVIAYHRSAAQGDANTRSWLVRFRVGAVAGGAAWGAAGVWLFPDHDVLHQMFLIFVLAGVTTGGVVSYSADRFSAIAFSILPVVPLIIRLFAAGDRLSAEMGVAVTLYMGFMLTNLLQITRNVYQGISLRHEAAVSEEKMRASERHLKQAQSIANMGSWKLDFATGKLDWSDELYRIYGVSPDTFTPTVEGLLSLLHPDDRPALQARLASRGASPRAKALEYRCVWPDGTIRYCEGQGDAIFDATGKPESISGTVQDITERKQYEQALNESVRKLEQKEMAKTRFLAAAGHDLRQPLAAANLFIDALKLTAPTTKQQEIINRLDQSMATFNGLLEALLNVSKLDAGMIKPEYKSIPVSELFKWMAENFAPLAREKQLGFKLYFPLRERLVVCGDIGLVRSVLLNLISNAIRFTAKGAVLVAARRRGNDVLFQVWDTGIGMTEANMQRIFDEFYQIDNPQRDRTKGLGLGLAIAKRALSLMDGEITCRSQSGRGSVFEFRLPLEATPRKASQPGVAAPAREHAVDGSFIRGKRFVVVEDDVLVAQAMVSVLEDMGGEVKCFHAAEDALHHEDMVHAHYVISDYMLGGKLNGIQFLNQLRQKLDRPINAVLMTGDTSPTLYVELTDFAWPTLHKPIDFPALISSLRAQED